MTNATRKALDQVDRILHEAGWDEPVGSPNGLPAGNIAEKLREPYVSFLREDYFNILDKTLGKGMTIPEAGKTLGLSSEEAEKIFLEALRRLSDFVEVFEGLSFQNSPAEKSSSPVG